MEFRFRKKFNPAKAKVNPKKANTSLVPLLALILLITFSSIALASSFVGATTTGKFHYTDCRWAKKIRDDHRIYFSSREEAVGAGYVPCKVCRP